jgi:outer membrane protein TolC
MNYKHNIAFLFILIGSAAWSQSKLSFEKALELTLANNYEISMAKVNEEIALNNSSKANNDYLPTLAASGSYNWTYFDGENRLITETRQFDANNSYNYNATATISYTIFNGMGRRYTYLQNKESAILSHLQLQLVIQNTIVELATIFHEVARLEESVEFLNESVAISRDRLSRAENQYEYGQAKKLDILNAKVDLNADSINLINGLQQLENAKRDLNFVMGQDVSQDLVVDNSIVIRNDLTKDEVVLSAESKNLELQIIENNLKINEYAIGASKSTWMPSINANAGYQYRGTEDPNGAFLIGSNNFGPQAGVALNWTIFNGTNQTQVKNAKLNLKNQQIQKQSLDQQIKSRALNSYTIYSNQLFILKSQADNVATAQDNFNRSKEAFDLGQINSIEFRQAQLNLINAEQALSNAKYDAKNAEFQVLAVMGKLVE